jgi:hypothetical protein
MANTSPLSITLKVKNTDVSGNIPFGLQIGELALNRSDDKLYYLDAANNTAYFKNSNSFSTLIANGTSLFATTPTSTLVLGPDSSNSIAFTANTDSDTITLAVDEANIVSFVRKAGDTMTGDLHVDTANVYANILFANTVSLADASISGNLQVSGTLSGPTIQAIDDYANASYAQANTATHNAASASQYANTGITLAQAAFDKANSDLTIELASFDHANSAYDQANTATNNAASASQYANSGITLAQAAYDFANSINTNENAAFDHANSAYDQANAAFNAANSASLYANTGINNAASASDYANTGINNAASASEYANTAIANAASASEYANTGITLAQSAFDYANSASMEVAVIDEPYTANSSSNTFFINFTDRTNSTVNSVFTNVDVLTYVPQTGTLSSNVITANTVVVSNISTISSGTVNLVNLYPSIVDRLDVQSFRSSSYHFQIENGLDSHMINMNVLNGDSLATFTFYGETFTYDSLGVFSANVASGMVNVLFTPHYAPMTVSFMRRSLNRLGIVYPPVDLGMVYNATTNVLDLGYIFLSPDHIVDYGTLADQLGYSPEFDYQPINGTVDSGTF